MKRTSLHHVAFLIAFILLVVSFVSCKKIAGLPLQEDVPHTTATIDPRVNMSAWDYIKHRALGRSTFKDSILFRMYQGVIYSGIDTNEYTKPDRTFILLHNDAILRRSGTTTTADSYFGKYRVNNVAATKWEDYPASQVKNYLLSLIVEGEHNFENVGTDPKFAKTLLPPGSDILNPESQIAFRIVNDRDSRFRINDFPGSSVPTPNIATPGIQARTAGIVSTNGPMHVIDRVLFYQKQ